MSIEDVYISGIVQFFPKLCHILRPRKVIVKLYSVVWSLPFKQYALLFHYNVMPIELYLVIAKFSIICISVI